MIVDLAWREVLLHQEGAGMKSVQEGVLALHKQHRAQLAKRAEVRIYTNFPSQAKWL